MDYFSEIDKSKFDYVIASVHYIIKDNICYPIDHSAKQQMDCIEDAFGGDGYKMAEWYYNSVVDHVKKNKPDVVGHFDVISKFGVMPEDDKYFNIAVNAMREAAKYCDMFEINTGAIARGYKTLPYPHKRLLTELYNIDGKVCINADSHNPKYLDLFFNESVDILREIGFSCFYVFNGNGFYAVNI
jgi:histidinol-phosphatase (PHP family)